MLQYHLFRCMTAMLYALIQWYPAYGPVALQSCKQLVGNVTYFSVLTYLDSRILYCETPNFCEHLIFGQIRKGVL